MEIPETVWAEAKALVNEFGKDDPQVYRQAYSELVARAIMAERERAADVAMRYAPATQDTFSDAIYDVCESISQAIRNPLHKQT